MDQGFILYVHNSMKPPISFRGKVLQLFLHYTDVNWSKLSALNSGLFILSGGAVVQTIARKFLSFQEMEEKKILEVREKRKTSKTSEILK